MCLCLLELQCQACTLGLADGCCPYSLQRCLSALVVDFLAAATAAPGGQHLQVLTGNSLLAQPARSCFRYLDTLFHELDSCSHAFNWLAKMQHKWLLE